MVFKKQPIKSVTLSTHIYNSVLLAGHISKTKCEDLVEFTYFQFFTASTVYTSAEADLFLFTEFTILIGLVSITKLIYERLDFKIRHDCFFQIPKYLRK